MPHFWKIITMLVLGIVALPASARSDAGTESRLVVALDPGHGGIDPGAESGALSEASLVLDFAHRLSRILEDTGRFDVVLTRGTDVTVPLDTRLTIARVGGADIFLSLHADALAPGTGQASGLTVYTLDDADFDHANLRLIARHDTDDILTGVDLTDAGEDVSNALVSLARRDAQPRSQALANALLLSFDSVEVNTNRRPHRHGGFAVLKAAEMPSVLIELGFLSNAKDRARLGSDEWLQEAALAIRDGLLLWQLEDRVFREQTLQ